jgi:hypothetical protein
MRVQQELPDQLAKAMAGRMSANGGTLVVRIDYVALGQSRTQSNRRRGESEVFGQPKRERLHELRHPVVIGLFDHRLVLSAKPDVLL